jgi:hypothetical protein
MGTPIPGGQCPVCQAFLWVRLVAHPPAPVARPAGPDQPCTCCTQCGAPLWVTVGGRPPVVRAQDPRTTALVPLHRKISVSERLRAGATTRRLDQDG